MQPISRREVTNASIETGPLFRKLNVMQTIKLARAETSKKNENVHKFWELSMQVRQSFYGASPFHQAHASLVALKEQVSPHPHPPSDRIKWSGKPSDGCFGFFPRRSCFFLLLSSLLLSLIFTALMRWWYFSNFFKWSPLLLHWYTTITSTNLLCSSFFFI